jgi:hypothetical protein
VSQRILLAHNFKAKLVPISNSGKKKGDKFMKNSFSVISCICLCLAVAMGFPRLSSSHPMVNASGCRECHDLGDFAIEGLHGTHTDCFACHDGPTELGTVNSSACLACHPRPLVNAETCDLVEFHEGSSDYMPLSDSCMSTGCHIDDDCNVVTTTTTGPGTTCQTKEIYGEGSREVTLLRAVRDNLLSQTPEGQELIKLYYRWSSVIVKAMETDEEFKEEFKNLLDELLPMIEKAVE